MSFPQKVIATGMSLVLAFGLSPIGQAPAYAAQKADQQPAAEQQADEALQTQSAPQEIGSWYVVPPATTYNGGDQRENILKGTSVTYIDATGQVQNVAFINEGGTYLKKLELIDANGTVIATYEGAVTTTGTGGSGSTTTDEIDIPTGVAADLATGAGSYTVRAYGDGTYAKGYRDSENYAVAPLDITASANASKLAFHDWGTTGTKATDIDWSSYSKVLPAATYTAKDQTIEIENSAATNRTLVPSFVKDGTASDEAKKYEKITYTAVTSAGAGAVKNFGNYAITMTANGNFTGTISGFSKQVARAAFLDTSDKKLALAGDESGTLSNLASATTIQQTLTNLSDPAGQGKVTYNGVELTRGTDYKVTYLDTSDAKATESETVPTALGTYEVKISAYGDNFLTADDATNNKYTYAKFTYKITPASVEDAAWATLDGVAYAGGDSTTNSPNAPVYAVPDLKTGKLLDAALNDICGAADGGYSLLAYNQTEDLSSYSSALSSAGQIFVWDANIEKAMLGEDAYYDKYKGRGYSNAATATASALKTSTWTDSATSSQVGAMSVAAPGDYGVVLVSGSKVVPAKFTVTANASLKEGAAAGDLYVTKVAESDITGSADAVYGKFDSSALTIPTIDVIHTAAADAKSLPTLDKLQAFVDYDVTIAAADGTELALGELADATARAAALNKLAVGTYDAKFTFKGGLAGTSAITSKGALVIDQRPLSELVDNTSAIATGYDSLKYTGYGLDTKVDLKKSGSEVTGLALDKDYKLVYDRGNGSLDADGKPVGIAADYQVKLQGIGNYKGDVAIAAHTLAVGKMELNGTGIVALFEDGTVAATNGTASTYRIAADGTAKTPSFRLVVKDEEGDYTNPKVIDSQLYEAAYTNNVAAHGDATITLTAKNTILVDDTSKGVVKFELTDAAFNPATDSITLNKESADYVPGGTADLAPIYSVTAGGKSLGEGVWYTMTITDESGKTYDPNQADSATTFQKILDAGTYTLTVTGGTNNYYAGSLTKEFKVNPFEIKQADLYNDKTNKTGKLVVPSLSEEYEYANDKATEYTFATDIVEADDTVTPASRPISGAGTYIKYNGIDLKAYEMDATVATKVKRDEDGDTVAKDYVTTGNVQSQAGEYEATVEFQGNYTGTVKVPYKVTPIEIDATTGTTSVYQVNFEDAADPADPSDYEVTYNGKAWEPKVWVSAYGDPSDEIADPSFKYTVTYENNVNAFNRYTNWQGAHAVVVADGNYSGTLDGQFRIKPVDIAGKDVTLEWGDQLGYTGEVVKPTGKLIYKAADGSTLELVHGTDYTTEYEGSPVNIGEQGMVTFYGQGNYGSYTLGAAADNFPGTRTATYTVEQGTQTIEASAASVKPVYGKTSVVTVTGAKTALTATVTNGTGAATATVSGDKVTIKGTKAGTATVKISAAGNDNVKASNELTVDVTVTKAANTLKVANAKRTVNAKALAKKAKKINGVKVSTKGQGTMVYKVTKVTKGKKSVAKKNFKVAKSSANKITVAKGLAKGTYKVTMTAKAKGNTNYSASKVLKKVVTVVVK